MDWIRMILGLLGGLGLFLYGMRLMSHAMERLAGQKAAAYVEQLNKRPLVSALLALAFGIVFTAVIQSSSATTVLVVGFVSAGIIPLSLAVYIIMGANIGTTVTSQLIALKLTDVAPLFIFLGLVLLMATKRRNIRFAAEALLGFGLLFIGISFMGDAMAPLGSLPEVEKIVQTVGGLPILGMLLGAVFTAVIQSSSACVGILQQFAETMQLGGIAIGLSDVMFFVMGSNIGTCVTALMASVGTNRMAKRTAWFHLLFNVGTTVLFSLLLWVTGMQLVKWLEFGGIKQQIANGHILFNVIGTLCFFFLAKPMIKLTYKLVPGEDPAPEPKKLLYVDEHTFKRPALVVPHLMREVNRMANLAVDNFHISRDMILKGDFSQKEKFNDQEQVLDLLNHLITECLIKANQLEFSKRNTETVAALYHVINDLERIGDHAENLMEFAEEKREKNVPFSQMGLDEIEIMFEKVDTLLLLALDIFNAMDEKRLPLIEPMEEEIDEMEKKLIAAHIERLNCSQCTPRAGLLFTSIINNLERVGDHATNIAFAYQNQF